MVVLVQPRDAEQGKKCAEQPDDNINNNAHGPSPFLIIFEKCVKPIELELELIGFCSNA